MKHVPDIFGSGVRLDGLDTLGDANRQNAALMESLTQHRVIDTQITRHRVDMVPWPCLDALGGPLDLVEQGQHITGIARIALGDKVGKDKTGGRFRDDTGLSAKLGRAIAFAFDNGSNRGIVGIDQFKVAELLAMGEPCGLLADVLMGAHRRAQLMGKTLALGLTERLGLFQTLLGLVGKGFDGLAKCEELLFGLSHQLDKDATLATAAPAKTPHDFFDLLLEALGLLVEWGRPVAARLSDVLDEF
jgi:hypothetical protein